MISPYLSLFAKVSALALFTLFCTFSYYDNLYPTYFAFSLSLTIESIPKSHLEVVKLPHWKASMDLEYEALVKQRTWVLVPRSTNTNVITCRWVFTLKYNPHGMIHQHKARLVAHGFSKTYGFSTVLCLNWVRIILSLAMNHGWSLHQLDVSNAFIYGDLIERVFMEKLPRYVV